MKRSKWLYAGFVLPALVLYSVFMLYPLISSLGLSLFSWNGYGPKTYVGFENFAKLFGNVNYSARFFGALKNNVIFFVETIILQNATALLLAALVNIRRIRGTKLFRSLYYLPCTLSIIVVGYIWTLIYNPLWGSLNYSMDLLGLGAYKLAWLGNEKTALLAIAIANAWQYTGTPFVMFLAGMNAVPGELYEAAEIDGASVTRQFFRITLPLIMPVMFIISVIVFVGNFSAFEIVYAMTGSTGAPGYSTDILGTFFYRTCFGSRLGMPPDMGVGAAIATCMFAIIGIAVAAWFKMSKRESDL
ncbi:MAG: sugar ABC transporter permease [Clostridiaceae bacterium]|nr:sugar ABC transporter permease [Clostridiaceae bacterium]